MEEKKLSREFRNLLATSAPTQSRDGAPLKNCLLTHEDGSFRVAGLMACGVLWCGELDHTFKEKCLSLAQSDPDLHVRVRAIDTLGGAYAESKDEIVCDCLHRIIQNPAASKDECFYAECSLNSVRFGVSAVDVLRKLERLKEIIRLQNL